MAVRTATSRCLLDYWSHQETAEAGADFVPIDMVSPVIGFVQRPRLISISGDNSEGR